ncbi:MAG: extracellular solute-binding protein [Clostridiales bacterium]|nr:extracellular solute-binding protein [Clostridiales bacterium]
MKNWKTRISLFLVICLMSTMLLAFTAASASAQPPVYGTNLIWDGAAQVNEGNDVSIAVWAPSGTIGDYYVKWAAEYMNWRPNVKIDVQLQTDDIAEKVILSTQSNTAPEMFFTHNGWTNAIVNTCGMPWTQDVFNLDGIMKDYVGLEQFLYNDNLYYIPYGIMTNGVFYNKTLWADAGLTDADIPQTWDELIEIAKKLTKADDTGYIEVAGFGFNGNQSFLLEALNYNDGLPLFDKDGVPIIDDPIVTKNIQFIKDLYDVHKVSSRDFDTAANTFATGESAMIFNWGWLTYTLQSTAPDLDYGYFQTPVWEADKAYPSYGRNGGDSSLAVSVKVTDPGKIEASFDFLTYLLANDDAVYEFDALLSMYPRKISLRENAELIEQNVVFKVLKDYVDRTVWPGPVPSSYIDINYLTYIIEPIFFEDADIAATLADAQGICTKALEEDGAWFNVERDYIHADEFIK